MIDRVVATIERYGMFRPGDRVGVAVSGGADSVCLLDLLRELAPRWALRLSVLHLDHGLRGEDSRRDAEFVRDLAARLGIPFRLGVTDLARVHAETGGNLEQLARNARREFFLRFLREGALDRVALGHTRSDQAETVLFRLLRGAGPSGLAGILPVTAEGFVRPLLEVSRQEARRYLEARGLEWREDRTNQDLSLARNRIRCQLLPALERDWNPNLELVLARLAALAQDEEEYWRREMDRLEATHAVRAGSACLLRTSVLAALPRAVARRLLRRLLERVRGHLRRLEYEHLEQVLRLASAGRGEGEIRLAGAVVRRSFDWLRIAPPEDVAPPGFRRSVRAPGCYALPDGTRLRLEIVEMTPRLATAPGYNRNGTILVDYDRIPGALEVRSWHPGDRYRPAGHTTTRSLKDLFQRARVPVWERRVWPVLEANGEIIWAKRFGPAADYIAGPESRCGLRISELPESPETSQTSQ